MSDAPKMVTERAAVERERVAYLCGAIDRMRTQTPSPEANPMVCTGDGRVERANAIARALYPLPKVTRPRVVKDPHDERGEWQVFPSLGDDPIGLAHPDISDGDFYGIFAARDDVDAVRMWKPTAQRVALWADLLENPTEVVDA